MFEFPSLEGEPLIHVNAHSSIGDWTIGVAVKKADLRAAVWNTDRWVVFLGTGISAASLLLAAARPAHACAKLLRMA